MNIVVIFFGLFSLATSFPNSINDDQNHEHRRNRTFGPESLLSMGVLMTKAKKISGSGYRGTDQGETCVIACMQKMNDAVNMDPELTEFVQRNSLPYRFTDRFNQSQLNKYCSKLNQTIDCVRPCSSGQMKDITEGALIVPRYICIESSRPLVINCLAYQYQYIPENIFLPVLELIEYAPCIHRINNESKESCDKTCQYQKLVLKRDMNNQPSSLTDIEKLMSNTCKYVDCDSDCDHTKIQEQCGNDAAKVYQGYHKKSVEGGRAMFRALGLAVDLPAECNSVGVADDDE